MSNIAENNAPVQEQLPTQINAKIHTVHTNGPVLANASIVLNGCFVIRGVKLISCEKGPFVSMPSYRSRDGYRDICFPCTKEFHAQLQMVVLDAYQQELSEIALRGREVQELPAPEMAM